MPAEVTQPSGRKKEEKRVQGIIFLFEQYAKELGFSLKKYIGRIKV